jgi:hypothetical protein
MPLAVPRLLTLLAGTVCGAVRVNIRSPQWMGGSISASSASPYSSRAALRTWQAAR